DDALMLDVRGFVAETNATHVFIVRGGSIYTSFTTACPEGITRATLLDLCRVHAISCRGVDLSLTAVYPPAGRFCSGTMGELASVIKVDGRTIGNGAPGPITQRLSGLYNELTANEGVQIV